MPHFVGVGLAVQRATILIIAGVCGAAAFLWNLSRAAPVQRPVSSPGFRLAPAPDRTRDTPTMEAAVLANPSDYDAWYILATLRQGRGNSPAATDAWRALRQAAEEVVTGGRPDEIRARFMLAWACEKLGDPDAAKIAIARASEAYEAGMASGGRLVTRYQAWMRLGWCRRMRGDEAAAREAWDRAAELLNQTHPTEMPAGMLYDRACCQALRGEKETAMWCLGQATQRGFRDFEWAAADESLSSLREDPGFKLWLATAKAPPAPTGATPATGR